MDLNEAAASGGGTTGAESGDDSATRARELGELEFLVGTSCSRAINLLMRSDRDPAELADELAFLGEKATRLATLLRVPGGAGATGAADSLGRQQGAVPAGVEPGGADAASGRQ